MKLRLIQLKLEDLSNRLAQSKRDEDLRGPLMDLTDLVQALASELQAIDKAANFDKH